MDDENTQGETQTPQSPKSNNPNPMLIGAVVVAVILAAVAGLFFMNKNKQAETVNDTSTAPVLESPTATEGGQTSGDVLAVEVSAKAFSFSPKTINAKLGQTVRVTLNSADLQHDFVIDELSVNSGTVTAGNSTTFEFLASEVGEFEFYCSVGNHRAMGMVGKLIVTE
jgi:plastocyanin